MASVDQVDSSAPRARPDIEDLVAEAPMVMVAARIEEAEPGGQRRLVFEYVSANVENFIGFKAHEVIADPFLWRGRIHPGDMDRAEASRAAALATSPFHEEIEFRLHDRDGHWRWINLVMDERAGHPGLAFGYAIDVTARRATESDLRASERQLQAFIENAFSSIYMKDVEGRYLMVNHRFLESVGLARDDVLGRTDAELFGAQAGTFVPNDIAVIERGEPMVFDEDFEQADGLHHYISSKFPLLDEQGVVYAMCGMSLDVTDRKAAADAAVTARHEAEEARHQAVEARLAAERANRAKSEFLSRMSHELRTPLNSILGFAQLLKLDELTDDQLESAELIERGGRHLLDLINEVLDIARIESGNLNLSIEPVEVGEVVAQALSMISSSAGARGISVEQSGPGWDAVAVLADRQRFLQIMLNLLSNALKYNRPNGTITVSLDGSTAHQVSVSVTDSGVGIPPGKVDAVFVPFERLGAEASEVEGTGVGLSLSRALAEQMGGTLDLTATSQSGSTFTVTLPGEPLGAPEPFFKEDRADATHAAGGASTPLTVLCVEDNAANLRLVERIFSRRPNISLLSAMTGSLGLELAQTHVPDLVMLDLHLPDRGGMDVLRELRADPRTEGLCVAIVSADASSGQIERLLAEGADHYLTKPIDVPALLALVDAVAAAKEPGGT